MNRSRSGLYVGRLFGIRFYLDYSWFLIAAIVTYMLGTRYFPALPELQDHADSTYLLMGVIAAALFFLSILLHELGHSVVSQRYGIRVPRITLLFIGGIAEISREPDNAKSELWIAIAGPAVSAALALFYGVLWFVLQHANFPAPAKICAWLAQANLTLIIFNAIPGYPLDGGRVLRALIWARTGQLRRATYITSRIGVGMSWMLMLFGIFILFSHRWELYGNAFVLLIVGIFLKSAAESGYTHAIYHEVLAGVQVKDVMTRNPICVPPTLPLNLVVDDYFLANHHTAFPVCDDEREFRGLLRLEYLKEVPREKWPFTNAGDVAADRDTMLLSLPVWEPAERAMRRLLQRGQGRLAVLDGKKVVGMITRHDVLQFIKIHTELES
jgi:Zn-dependent protease/predicted transcriptional regulator